MAIRFVSSSLVPSSSFYARQSGSESGSLVSTAYTVVVGKDLGEIKGDFDDDKLKITLASQSFGGSNDINVLTISASNNAPRVGIGITDPKRAFDFKEVRDDNRGGEILIRGSRSTKGAEVGDEAGRLNFVIDSASFNDIETSGSVAQIVSKVTSEEPEGVYGELSFQVAETAKNGSVEHLRIDASGAHITGTLALSSYVRTTAQNNALGSLRIGSYGSSIDYGDLSVQGGITLFSADSNALTLKNGSLYLENAAGNRGHITASGNISSSGDITATNGSFSGDLTVDGNITAQQYIVSSSVTYTTQSFSSGSTIFGDTLDDTHQFTGSVDITGSLTVDGMLYPTTDGLDRQVIKTDGNGNLTFGYSENVEITVKNVSGGTIFKGTPCFITASGTSGNIAGIIPADAGDPTKMPAGIIAGEDILDEAEGLGLLNGFIQDVDTSIFASGDTVYVAVGGGYTNTKPTGSALIQKLGNVEKSDANGSGVINGPGYYNEVPNITSGYAWVGNSDQVATAVATSSFVVDNANTASYVAAANIDGTVDISFQTNLAVGNGITLTGDTLTVTAGTGLTQNAGGLAFDADGGTLTTNNADVDHILINDGGTFKRITKGNINVGDFNNDAGYLTSSPFTAAGISGSFNSVSASLAADIPTNNNQLTNGAGYTTNTGTVTSITAGTGLSGGTITTTGTISVDYGGTGNIITNANANAPGYSAADDFIIRYNENDEEVQKTSVANFISGYNLSTVTEVTVGTGLDVTNGTTTPNVTLDLTEVIASDAANRVLTSDGDGTLTAESELTYDGTTLNVDGYIDIDASTNSQAVVDITNTNTTIPMTVNNYALKVAGGAAIGTPGGQTKAYGGYFTAGNTNAQNPDSVALYAQGHEDGAPNSYAAIFSGSAGGVVGINTMEPTVELEVDGDTKITGNLELGTVTDVEARISSYRVAIMSNGFYSQADLRYLTYNTTTETTGNNYISIIPAAANGRVISVTCWPQSSGGSSELAFYVNGGTASTTDTQTLTAGVPVQFTFSSGNTFSALDELSFSIDPTNTPNGLSFQIILEYDY